MLSGGHIVDAQPGDVAEVVKCLKNLKCNVNLLLFLFSSCKVVNHVVDPLMQCIEDTAARLPRLDQAAYTLNCYYQIHSSLSLYGVCG